jgi:hypothetical protein
LDASPLVVPCWNKKKKIRAWADDLVTASWQLTAPGAVSTVGTWPPYSLLKKNGFARRALQHYVSFIPFGGFALNKN